jgi:hypothetical protein
MPIHSPSRRGAADPEIPVAILCDLRPSVFQKLRTNGLLSVEQLEEEQFGIGEMRLVE